MTPTPKFYIRCKIDQLKGMPSLVTLLPFVFELSSKNNRGAKMTPPPPTRAKVNLSSDGVRHTPPPPPWWTLNASLTVQDIATKLWEPSLTSILHFVFKNKQNPSNFFLSYDYFCDVTFRNFGSKVTNV